MEQFSRSKSALVAAVSRLASPVADGSVVVASWPGFGDGVGDGLAEGVGDAVGEGLASGLGAVPAILRALTDMPRPPVPAPGSPRAPDEGVGDELALADGEVLADGVGVGVGVGEADVA